MPKTVSMFNQIVASEPQPNCFRYVSQSRAYVAARIELQRAFELLPSPDGNFVKDFQSTGFDARIWEMYLAAFAHNLNLVIEQPYDRPDFLLKRGAEGVWVEAVTANPTEGVQPSQPANDWEGHDELAAKLGSPLFSKLNKRYWELPYVSNTPLVLAIADFHDPGPFRHGAEPLQRYLYGRHLKLMSKPGERVDYKMLPLNRLGPKNVPAGFFN